MLLHDIHTSLYASRVHDSSKELNFKIKENVTILHIVYLSSTSLSQRSRFNVVCAWALLEIKDLAGVKCNNIVQEARSILLCSCQWTMLEAGSIAKGKLIHFLELISFFKYVSNTVPVWQILVHLWVRQLRILLHTCSHSTVVAWPHLTRFLILV